MEPGQYDFERWFSRDGQALLNDLATGRVSVPAAAKALGLAGWETKILWRAMARLHRGRARGARRNLPRWIRNLAQELDLLRAEEAERKRILPRLHQRGFRGNHRHLELLLRASTEPGPDNPWNAWRRRHPGTVADLAGADLTEVYLKDVNLAGARLDGANLSLANLRVGDLRGAKLREAALVATDLSYADLAGADLTGATLRDSFLTQADLTDAILRNSNLVNSLLSRARIGGADFNGALIWGCSAWDLEDAEKARQDCLYVPTAGFDPIDFDPSTARKPWMSVRTSSLEAAHFLSMVASYPHKIAHVLVAASERIVLVLGRFKRPYRESLDTLVRVLPDHGYAPIVFDFEGPPSRDVVETTATLAGLSRFVIADLSAPMSTPLEAQLIIPLVAVPFVPIIRKREKVFSMFLALQRKYPWVLPLVVYDDPERLARRVRKDVIEPAEARRARLISMKQKEAVASGGRLKLRLTAR